MSQGWGQLPVSRGLNALSCSPVSAGKSLLILLAVVHLFLVSACSPLPRKAVPASEIRLAEVPGFPKVRAWAGSFNSDFEADLIESVRQEQAAAQYGQVPHLVEASVLAISGGADYGAFGAGFLNGWTASGQRPIFKLVTGISTGAILAPFAFLGSDYDAAVRAAYTTITLDDVYRARGLASLWSDSLADSEPLARLLERFIPDEMIRAVGREHLAGRRLYVGTTNLDADRLVIWNMGQIAASERADACDLFRRVILASASIPGISQPIMIEVALNGQRYDEMHVDGGVKAQFFVLAATIDTQRLRAGVASLTDNRPLKTKLYVLRNTKVAAEAQPVNRHIADISARALSSMVKSRANYDLERLYQAMPAHGFELNWVAVPDEYQPSTLDMFDQAEMNRVFAVGLSLGRDPQSWRHEPPGYE